MGCCLRKRTCWVHVQDLHPCRSKSMWVDLMGPVYIAVTSAWVPTPQSWPLLNIHQQTDAFQFDTDHTDTLQKPASPAIPASAFWSTLVTIPPVPKRCCTAPTPNQVHRRLPGAPLPRPRTPRGAQAGTDGTARHARTSGTDERVLWGRFLGGCFLGLVGLCFWRAPFFFGGGTVVLGILNHVIVP